MQMKDEAHEYVNLTRDADNEFKISKNSTTFT